MKKKSRLSICTLVNLCGIHQPIPGTQTTSHIGRCSKRSTRHGVEKTVYGHRKTRLVERKRDHKYYHSLLKNFAYISEIRGLSFGSVDTSWPMITPQTKLKKISNILFIKFIFIGYLRIWGHVASKNRSDRFVSFNCAFYFDVASTPPSFELSLHRRQWQLLPHPDSQCPPKQKLQHMCCFAQVIYCVTANILRIY